MGTKLIGPSLTLSLSAPGLIFWTLLSGYQKYNGEVSCGSDPSKHQSCCRHPIFAWWEWCWSDQAGELQGSINFGTIRKNSEAGYENSRFQLVVFFINQSYIYPLLVPLIQWYLALKSSYYYRHSQSHRKRSLKRIGGISKIWGGGLIYTFLIGKLVAGNKSWLHLPSNHSSRSWHEDEKT